MYKDQKGQCKLSGETLSLQGKSKYLVSIDRINSNKGYTIDNIQLVTKIVNQAKSNLDDNTFNRMIKGLYVTKCKKEHNNIVKNNNEELELKIEKLKIISRNLLKEKDRLEKVVQQKNKEIQQFSKKNHCLDCNMTIHKDSTRCVDCNNKFIVLKNVKGKRPPYQQLLKDLDLLENNILFSS